MFQEFQRTYLEFLKRNVSKVSKTVFRVFVKRIEKLGSHLEVEYFQACFKNMLQKLAYA